MEGMGDNTLPSSVKTDPCYNTPPPFVMDLRKEGHPCQGNEWVDLEAAPFSSFGGLAAGTFHDGARGWKRRHWEGCRRRPIAVRAPPLYRLSGEHLWVQESSALSWMDHQPVAAISNRKRVSTVINPVVASSCRCTPYLVPI